MIEVVIDQTGDWATAYPEHAIACAKTLAREAYDASGGTIKPTVTFKNATAGEIIRANVPERELWLHEVNS